MIRIAVHGAGGRMGVAVVAALVEHQDAMLSAALARPGSEVIGRDAGVQAGVGPLEVPISGDLAGADFDVLIDFSRPPAALACVEQCARQGRGVVIGTTGFDVAGRAQITRAARTVPVVFAPNMSVGVNVGLRLVEMATRLLGDQFDVEVLEAHHGNKVDAPSGTALAIGEAVAQARGRRLEDCAVYDRHGDTGIREPGSIGFGTLRGGDIVGEHTVMFAGRGERVEITHRAWNRAIFARGAVRAARWLAGREAGLYDMQDVLG